MITTPLLVLLPLRFVQQKDKKFRIKINLICYCIGNTWEFIHEKKKKQNNSLHCNEQGIIELNFYEENFIYL